MTMSKLVQALIVFVLFCRVHAETEEDYYVNLVNQEIANALTYQLPNDAKEYQATIDDIEDFGTYDFVVIGGGCGGAVVANRLSEVPDWKVLVLEAGGLENNFTDIPGMYFYVESSKYNWNYKSTPQQYVCQGMENKQCLYARGKGYGGTTLINGLVYARGNKADYDKWAAEGNVGWSYKDVLKYFIKSENTHINNADDGFHGTNGYMNIEYHRPYSKQFYAFIDANKELGFKELDYNGKNQIGVSRAQALMVNGRRESSSKAFLNPVMSRSNLELCKSTFVTKIIIDPKSKMAKSVEFTKFGKKYRVNANREVILAAGSIGSAQILMLSGVGPKGHLQEMKIPVLSDLPVGENLIDHPTYYGLNILSNHTEPILSTRDYVKEYLKGEGPYAVAGNNQGVGFFQSSWNNVQGRPDIEMMIIPSNRTNSYYQKSFGFTEDTFNALTKNIQNNSTFTVYIVCLHPKGIGNIKLKSNNPFEYPLIDSNWLSDKNNQDIDVLFQGIRLVQKMLKTKAMKQINARMDHVDLPACKKFDPESKKYWYCAIRHMTMNLYHPMGTNKMAPKNKGGVVDNRLRVYGVKKLRVADASAIPYTMSGHPVAPITMIAEKVSDLIKQDNGVQI